MDESDVIRKNIGVPKLLSSIFSVFLWDGRSQRGRRIWEGEAQTLSEKRLEACVLGERNADGERRAQETPHGHAAGWPWVTCGGHRNPSILSSVEQGVAVVPLP